ncbi:hypothetical protein JMJ35_004496 [Cladonia borealis]|uniref:DUF7707 domain-containing protein n=1 Tax=Cladonia borealis TaxID=184061 RepID=A0AA39V8S0_9LECA|nr:hypothetical protein JMJ35_004496 [Cladonia borealis]
MLSFTLLFTTLLAAFAAAQNNTLDPNSVDPTKRNQWCTSEQNTCPILCGGQMFTKANSCTGSTLTYTCTCANGTGPSNIAQYQGSLPNYECNQLFADCRQANPGSQACVTCGTLQPSTVPTGTVSSSAAATSSATSTSSTTSPSASAKGNAAGKVEGTVGGVAAGLLAALVL